MLYKNVLNKTNFHITGDCRIYKPKTIDNLSRVKKAQQWWVHTHSTMDLVREAASKLQVVSKALFRTVSQNATYIILLFRSQCLIVFSLPCSLFMFFLAFSVQQCLKVIASKKVSVSLQTSNQCIEPMKTMTYSLIELITMHRHQWVANIEGPTSTWD